LLRRPRKEPEIFLFPFPAHAAGPVIQHVPELFHPPGLQPETAAGVGFGIHGRRLTPLGWKIIPSPLPNPLPIRPSWGEGIKALEVDYIGGGFVSLRFVLMPCSVVCGDYVLTL
jgi:hypothetical protein